MDESNKADNTAELNNSAAENPATSQNNSGAGAASSAAENKAVEQDKAPEQGTGNAEQDITETKAFSKRLKEETEKARAAIEKEFAEKAKIPEVRLTHDERTALKQQRDNRVKELTAQGMDASLAYTMARDEEIESKENLLDSKREAAQKEAERKQKEEKGKSDAAAKDERIKALEAEVEKLKATDKAKASNAKAAAASTGPLNSEPAQEHELTEEEFDKLPRAEQRKHIKNGDYWKWAPKWAKK